MYLNSQLAETVEENEDIKILFLTVRLIRNFRSHIV